MKFARIINNIAQEVIDFNPQGRFHPDVAAVFEAVPDNVNQNATRNGQGVWTAYIAPIPVPVVPVVIPPKVSPVQYKLLFTIQELVAIAQAKETDPVLQALYGILDDPRLTEVDLALQATQDGLTYLVSEGLITEARKTEILKGVIK